VSTTTHISLLCKLLQDKEHPPCSGTCDGHGSGQLCGLPCECACHREFVQQLRPTWDQYFLGICQAVAVRSDCLRRHVGAVVVVANRVVATGYNGSAPGAPNCAEAPCPRLGYTGASNQGFDTPEGRCIAFHAEENAVRQAGPDCEGATLYSTHQPCSECWKLIYKAGIDHVVVPHHPGSNLPVTWKLDPLSVPD
jgi:dCMP deaminase